MVKTINRIYRINVQVYENLRSLGISPEDAIELIHLSRKYHKWDEDLCNYISIDDQGKAYFYIDGVKYETVNKEIRYDKRLNLLRNKYPNLWFYRQTDPRGASIFVGHKSDNINPEINYTQGVAVY